MSPTKNFFPVSPFPTAFFSIYSFHLRYNTHFQRSYHFQREQQLKHEKEKLEDVQRLQNLKTSMQKEDDEYLKEVYAAWRKCKNAGKNAFPILKCIRVYLVSDL